MNYFELLKLVPILFDIIKAVEAALPESGKGKEKLQLVREVLQGLFGDLTDMWPKIEKVITTIVTFLNAMGVFRKP